MNPKFSTLLPLVLLLAATGRAVADEPQACQPAAAAAPLPDLGDEADASLRLSADRAESANANVTRFSGDVIMLRSGRRVEAQQAQFDKSKNILELDGDVRFYSNDIVAKGASAHLDINGNTGELRDASYQYRRSHAYGSAAAVTLSGNAQTTLESATYTTCDPARPDWLMSAGEIELDDAANLGEARNVTVEFKGLPFIYLPYLNFPLHGRKSGLLAPHFGNSDSTGTDIGIPYYWNIAPEQDATLTPRFMSARGTMLQGEYRYLLPSGGGQLNLEALPGDKRYNDRDRLYGTFGHDAALDNGWHNQVVYNYVSDDNYFNDLGGSQATASTTFLERRFDLSYQGNGWNFLGRAQAYQSLLPGTEPYQRLPQLRLDAATPERPGTLRYTLGSELVHFAHGGGVPTGTRLDLEPAVDLPLQGAAWFATTHLALRQTSYQLNNATATTPSRTLPIASLDSGLYFDRDLTVADRPMTQTLEPRLYYLYVPFRDQTDLPLFDTALNDFSFDQLFRDNRYSGADRQSDANQLTLAFTTRLQDGESGRELVRGSLGQIRYYSDRRVTLPGSAVEQTQGSDLAAEVGVRPAESLDVAASALWNPDANRDELFTSHLRFRPADNKLLSLDYRFRRDLDLRQTDLVAYWPLSQRWRLLARWNYDLKADETLEALGGVAYEDCCWAVHFAARQRRDVVTDAISRSLFITLELKGLSSLGHRLEDELPPSLLHPID